MRACMDSGGVGGGSVGVYYTTSGITDMTLSSVTCLGEGRFYGGFSAAPCGMCLQVCVQKSRRFPDDSNQQWIT